MRDEEQAKRHETCPKCGQSLWYYAESPTYSEEFVRHAAPGQAPGAEQPFQPVTMRAAAARAIAAEIRAWAAEHGYTLAPHERIPAAVIEAWRAQKRP
jgi:hypothetical protein